MRVLLTGATGYIGRRLLDRLQADKKLKLRLFVRHKEALHHGLRPGVEVCEGDTFNMDSLRRALKGVYTAYYLIHSMGAAKGNFEELDRVSAQNFRDACIGAGVRRIIYLGGLGVKDHTSRHLRSRIETGEILSAFPDRIQTIWFRAGIIIGSGGASFEIIHNLVDKLPVMIAPRWVHTLTQSVGLDDVLEYLDRARKLRHRGNLVVDIGSGRMSFLDMLRRAASVLELRRVIIPVPFFSPKMSSYWLILFTPVPFRIARALVDGLKYETLMQNDNAKRFFPGVKPVSYEEALLKALQEMENEQVVSRWSDGSHGEVHYIEERRARLTAVHLDSRRQPVGNLPASKIYQSIMAIGGENGWFRYGFLWKLRGHADKLAGGAGLNRGRRHRKKLRIGDCVDFWKVIDIEHNKRLLLLAQMKMPGKGWLEFVIEPSALIQTAYFVPKGVAGVIYWYMMFPFHAVIFRNMAREIVRRAEQF